MPPAVELEHPEGVAAGQQLEGRRVVQGLGERVEVDLSPRLASMLAIASSRMVRLRRPRKSILTSPSFSQLG
jgi:hypothetical protein